MKKQHGSLALVVLLAFAVLMTGMVSAGATDSQFFKTEPVIEFLMPDPEALVFHPVDGEVGVKLNNVLQDTLMINYGEDTWFGIIMTFTLNAPVSGDTTIRLTDLNGHVTEYENELKMGTTEQKLEIYAKTEYPTTEGYLLEIYFGDDLALSQAIGEGAEDLAATETEAEATEEATAPASASVPGVFPLQYEAFGNNYSITSYAVGTGDTGNTEITFYGAGYDVMPIRDGQLRVPVWCDFVSGGTTYECVSASVSSDNIVILFEESATPEEIIIQNGETWDEMARFTVDQ